MRNNFIVRYAPVLLLSAIILALFTVMALRGLELGYFGDLLNSRFLLDKLGVRGGIEWMAFTLGRRHILGSVQHGLMHVLAPDHSSIWYGSALLTQFLAAIPAYALVNSLLRGQRRWIAFGVALAFMLHVRQLYSPLDISTRAFINISFMAQLLSLWAYLHYVRDQRRSLWMRDVSLLLYFVALNLYETAALFFLLHPLLAWHEEYQQRRILSRDWLWQMAKDNFWYGFILVAYLAFLLLYLPSDGVGTGLNSLSDRLFALLNAELHPLLFAERYAPAFAMPWLPLTLLLIAATALGIGWWRSRHRTETALPDAAPVRSTLGLMIVLGVGMMVLNMGVAVQVNMTQDIRFVYPFAFGFTLAVVGLLALLAQSLPHRPGTAVFAGGIALLAAPGVGVALDVQQQYLDAQAARSTILEAIFEAVPAIERDGSGATPYLLIFTDPDETRQLYHDLRADDAYLPMLFEMEYGLGINVDMVLYDVPDARCHSEGQSAAQHLSLCMVAQDGLLYSTLRPPYYHERTYQPGSTEHLILLYYDADTQTAQVLDTGPPELLAQANIVERDPVDWQTNWDILPQSQRP